VPTAYPKCSPTEMSGFLVLLNDHHGDEDIARLANDLHLEIDEIFPSVEFAEVLQLVKVGSGRASLTDLGKRLLAGSITERKTLLRDQLRKTTLYKALLRALDSSPEHRLSDEHVNRLISFTTAPADEFVQNIINWGRYTELFRYDANQHVLLPARARPAKSGAGSSRPPSGGTGESPPSRSTTKATQSAGDRGNSGGSFVAPIATATG